MFWKFYLYLIFLTNIFIKRLLVKNKAKIILKIEAKIKARIIALLLFIIDFFNRF